MKRFKRVLKTIVLLTALLTLGLYIFSRTLYPTYSGELKLSNLSDKVTVYYDEIGVPHINAENQKDAYTALGYVHAQDRLWQMEVMRRIAAGRLAEIFGKDLVRVDKFMSGLGIEENAAKTIANLDTNTKSYKMAIAYLDGINQFMEKGPTPVEFYLVGVKKEKYTLKDIYNVFGYMAFSFAAAHKTDPILNEVKEKFGAKHLQELGVPVSDNTFIKNQKNPEIVASFSRSVDEIINKLPVPVFIGSNSWVVGPKKTKNGKVIFANDPHINFSQPSVWYQNHIKTPDYEVYGFNLALTPYPLLSHNRNFACGLTMFENDDIDFYIEQNNPKNDNEYKTPEGYLAYELVDKRIKIKGQKDTVYQIKVSKHGPIMNDVIDHLQDERPLAMKWVYIQLPNKSLELTYEMSHANSLKEFKKGTAKLHAPGLNVMYGDSKGNIAWFAAAKLYQYRDSVHTKVYLDGASGKDEVVRYLDFEENPQAINPTWNYVYSANNQPDTINGKLYPGYYLPGDRAKRIVELLEANNNFTKEDMMQMINDVTSSAVGDIIKNMTSSLESEDFTATEQKVLGILTKWDGSYTKKQVAPTIYNRFVYEFLARTFKDEFGKGFEVITHTPFQKNMLGAQAAKQNSVWWDDVATKNTIETKKDIVTASFKSTIAFLRKQLGENSDDWTWDKVLSVEYEHPIGKAGGILRTIFNVGPFTTIGGNEVLNNQQFKLNGTGYYNVHAGPSTRRVIDFSDVENSVAILPTGQSGNIFSPYYKDQAQKYLNGEFVKMKLNQQEIEQSKNKLVLLPELGY